MLEVKALDAFYGPVQVLHGISLSVPTGSIVFAPDLMRGATGPVLRADIQPDGTYYLRTGERSGAAPGWYHVTLLALEQPRPTPPGFYAAAPRSLLPERYRDPELSGLVCEVKAIEENVLDFHLD